MKAALLWLDERLGDALVLLAYGLVRAVEWCLCLLGRCDCEDVEAW